MPAAVSANGDERYTRVGVLSCVGVYSPNETVESSGVLFERSESSAGKACFRDELVTCVTQGPRERLFSQACGWFR